MENEFKVKKLLCDLKDLHVKTDEMESQWLEALLLRIGIPSLILKRRESNKMDNQQWRHYLFDSFNIEIHKSIESKQVEVVQHMQGDREGETEIIAEWSKPGVTKFNKRGERPYYELRLKYWQLV